MKWNEAQLSAIMSRNNNILVSAAAGSGKTAVLTERIKRLITDEGVGIDEMLIVTFTNAAAGEMRERIYKGISESMEEEGADLEYLQEQLDKIGKAYICTFHAFCLELIREYFYLTELTPDFRICDDAQKAIYQGEAIDTLIKEFFEKESNEDFLGFVRKYAKPGNERGIAEMLLMVYEFIMSLPNPFEWLSESIEKLNLSEDEIEKKTYTDAMVLKLLIERYHEIFMAKKHKANMLDFSDIEHTALEILEKPEPQNEYRERFKHIFIDEYQDTNSVQEELISRIKRKDNLFMVGDVKQSIYQFRLADPGIFIEKYRKYRDDEGSDGIKIDLNRNFRSKPEILDATNEVMTSIMTEETCGISYDESAMLYPGFDYEKENSSGSKKVKLDIIDEYVIKEELIKLDSPLADIQSAELEAMFVCNRIKEVLGQEYFDYKENCLKRVTYDDIVVLMRSFRGTADIYQEAFDREGIPAYVEGNDGYFETVEISVFANLLRIIVNRRQDIPLLSVMRSAMFGFSADEMSRIRILNKTGLFSDAFISYCENGEDEELRKKCRFLLNKLDRWRDESGYMSLKEFLWKLSRESGFYEFIRALPLGAQRIRNLKSLFDKARVYQSNTCGDLSGFIRYLQLLETNSATMTTPIPGGENESFVRLMSIHKSKGLEFPVVIVAGAGKQFNHRKASGEISLDKNLGFGLKYRDEKNESNMKTNRQLDIDAEVKGKELAEEMRLLYVAMTRAREQLIITGCLKRKKEKKSKKDKKDKENKENKVSGSTAENNEGILGDGKDILECTSYMEWLSQPLTKAGKDKGIEVNLYTKIPNQGYIDYLSEEELDAEAEGKSFEIDIEEEKAEGAKELLAELTEEELEEYSKIKEQVYAEMNFSYRHKEAAEMPGKFTATELNRIMKEAASDLEYTGADIFSSEAGEAELYETKFAQLTAKSGGGEKSSSIAENVSYELFVNREVPVWKEKSEAISAAEKGTITHKVLQELDFSRTATIEELAEQIDEMIEREVLTERDKAGVRFEWIHRMFESELGKRMKKSKRLNKEKAFLLWKPFDEETGSIVQGIIDCFFEEEGEAVLLDYKTDYISQEDKEAAIAQKALKYKTQMAIYKEAIEKSTGLKVKEAYLYFLSVGECVKL